MSALLLETRYLLQTATRVRIAVGFLDHEIFQQKAIVRSGKWSFAVVGKTDRISGSRAKDCEDITAVGRISNGTTFTALSCLERLIEPGADIKDRS